MNSKKIKLGLYLDNKGMSEADLRFPERGNPGIGGSQFTTVTTAYYLNKLYSEIFDIVIFANLTKLLPSGLNIIYAENSLDAAFKAKEECCDIVMFRETLFDNDFYQELGKLNIKSVVRSNNIPRINSLKKIADCPQVKCYVCTGQEQLDLVRDHKIFSKTTRIFDVFNVDKFVPQKDIVKQGNTVVFLGSIVPDKGFHHLARVWPIVLKQMPEARLIVIGSGQLYNRNIKLGKWGIAEENYEENFIRPFLSDDSGNIIESVHFAGLLGEEKIPILQNADVGVINPTGFTEVCPASALEIQACGTPVVSASELGLLDTVLHGKTGLLGNGDKKLVNNITYLLKNPTIAKEFGKNGIDYVREKFDYKLITKQWSDLFIDIYNDKPIKPQTIKENYLYKAKFLREGMRIAKENIPILQRVPALIEFKESVRTFIKK